MAESRLDAAREAALALSLGDAAPALQEQAVRIRRRLGEWPAPARRWRIVPATDAALQTIGPRAAGDARAGASDLVLCEDGMQDAVMQAFRLTEGAAVLAVSRQAGASESRARLDWNGQRYTLAGHPEPDWPAALAAFLDCGCEPEDALCLAWGWSDTDTDGATDEAGPADAWPTRPQRMPRVLDLPAAPVGAGFAPCPQALGLYPLVTDADWVARLLDLGVTTVQLRIKAEPGQDTAGRAGAARAREIARAAELGRAYDARVFINDHWQSALEAGAYGVHLGQEDLRSADLDAIARAGMRLGLSTHGIYEMLLAWHFRPSYLAFGAVFPTRTKQLASHPQGLARLARFVALFGASVPTVAIGGIDLERLPQVLATGVGSAAVVRAVDGADTAAAVAALRQVFEAHAAQG